MFTNLDDPNQPYSCNQWGNRHVQWGDDNAVITADAGYTMFNWFNTGSAFPSVVFIDHTMTIDYMANFTGGANGGINRINNLLNRCGALCSGDPILGCTDDLACNFNENADQDDGSCEYETCLGCTDSTANNYDEDALIDDGSCTYSSKISFGQIDDSNIEINFSSDMPMQGFQFTVTDDPDLITLTGAYGGLAEENGFTVSTSNLGIVIGFSFNGDVIPSGEGLLTNLTYDGIGPAELCFEDIIISDSNGGQIGTGPSDCVVLNLIPNPGDTNLDDSVNVQDIVVLLNFILNFDEPSQQQFINGDMNDDEVLNVLDVIRIVNNILGFSRQDFSFSQNDFGIVNFVRSDNDLVLSVYSEIDYSGVQFSFESNKSYDILLKDNSHISLEKNFINGRNIVVAYSMFNEIFDGHEAVFTIVNGATLDINSFDILVGDVNGNAIDLYFNELDENELAKYTFNINSVYPNPFNPSTDISFTIPNSAYVKLSAFNIKGQEVDVIFEGYQDKGVHSYTWDASKFSSGIYYFNLNAGNNVSTAKGIYIK